MQEFIENQIDIIANNFKNLKKQSFEIVNIANICIEAIEAGNKLIFCGNGGSAADCQHTVAELVGKYKKERPAIAAIALTVDTSIITSLANDISYENIFERQLEALGKKGDILFGISTSGNSKNVTLAFKKAKKLGIKTIALLGKNKGTIGKNADYILNTPSDITNNIQEMHIAIEHLICELIENNIKEKK